MNVMKRPAFGQSVPVGTLYDARIDSFLPGSLLKPDAPADSITFTALSKAEADVVTSDSFRDKFDRLGVNRELSATFLAGQIKPLDSSRYLSLSPDSLPAVHRAIVYTITSMQEQLNFMYPDLRNFLNLSSIQASKATHIVMGITWGARAIVSIDERIISGAKRSHVEQTLDGLVNAFFEPPDTPPPVPGAWKDGSDTLRVKYFSDLLDVSGDAPGDLTGSLDLLRYLPHHMQSTEGGRGKPHIYLLCPLGFLMTLGVMMSTDTSVTQLIPEIHDKLIKFLDEMEDALRSLKSYNQILMQNRSHVSMKHLSIVEDRLHRSRQAATDLKSQFAGSLKSIRTGQATSQSVSDAVDNLLAGDLAPTVLIALTQEYSAKLQFISMAVQIGAEYTDASTENELVLRSQRHSVLYIFHFSTAAMDAVPSWEDNVKLLQDLLTKKPKPSVLLVDCDLMRRLLPNARISVYASGNLAVSDLLEQQKELANKHLIKYDKGFLEAVDNVPAHRSSVKLVCPGSYCSQVDICTWVCFKCHEEIEFGSRDGYFYCECGRYPFDRVVFNCQKPTHIDGFATYHRSDLKTLLLNLPPPREVNILILGETGVGKSTFVNAFINYLTFSSLDEGLTSDKLHWIIPCSFTTQLEDSKGRLISRDIVIGADADERDGSKGQSATQQATVYPLYFKDTLIRLIDTPGIGDTRGLDQDRKNMANVLSVLRNYPNLHGILILLKPNNARLGVMFRFCVKELLTHLHLSAAQNMVFGFTNTRGSNYTPGDTFKPLESLLSEYREVIPGLFKSNVYCFDSESFRYLAARKENIEMGNIEDYRRSWDKSGEEAERLLAHFRSLDPHNTQKTLSLNETRHMILQLTAPMQQISAAIMDTIAQSEKQCQELRDTKLEGDALQAKLHISTTAVKATQLSKPKTVCAHEKCVEVVYDEGTNSNVKLRKNLCHNPCCLTNVPVGKVGTPQLVHCAAFSGENCMKCKHHWKDHEHIMVEYSKSSKTIVDDKVQRDLARTGDVVKAKETTIAALKKQIAELRLEHKAIQEAAAKFSIYLKRNSITHYNDATEEYLEHMIKDEKTKARVGTSRARLEMLEKDLQNYQKFVQTMEQGKNRGGSGRALDEGAVVNLIKSLYNLPHYGAMLKDLASVVGRAYEANFRERPYRVSRRRNWSYGDIGSIQNGGWCRPRQPSRSSYTPGKSMIDDAMMGGPKKSPSHSGLFGPVSSKLVSRRRPDSTNAGSFGPTKQEFGTPSSNNPFTSSVSSPVRNDKQPLGEEEEFWPSSSSTEKPQPKVQSISDWDDSLATETQPSRNPFINRENAGGPFSSFRSSRSSIPTAAPPPYRPFDDNGVAQQRGDGMAIVQKKGVWLKVKEKLRKT